MKKYLLLVEDEKLWEKFKDCISRDINSEIIELIKRKIEKKSQQDGKLRTEVKNVK